MGSGWVGLQRQGLFQVSLWELSDSGRVVLPRICKALRYQSIRYRNWKMQLFHLARSLRAASSEGRGLGCESKSQVFRSGPRIPCTGSARAEPSPDLPSLNLCKFQNLHCNQVPGWFSCIIKTKKQSYCMWVQAGSVVSAQGAPVEAWLEVWA